MTTDTNGVSWEGREKKRKICHKVTTPVAMIMIYEDDFRVCQYLQIKTQDGNHNIMMFNPKREHLISSMMLSLPWTINSCLDHQETYCFFGTQTSTNMSIKAHHRTQYWAIWIQSNPIPCFSRSIFNFPSMPYSSKCLYVHLSHACYISYLFHTLCRSHPNNIRRRFKLWSSQLCNPLHSLTTSVSDIHFLLSTLFSDTFNFCVLRGSYSSDYKRWRQQILPEHWCQPTKIYSRASEKTVNFTFNLYAFLILRDQVFLSPIQNKR